MSAVVRNERGGITIWTVVLILFGVTTLFGANALSNTVTLADITLTRAVAFAAKAAAWEVDPKSAAGYEPCPTPSKFPRIQTSCVGGDCAQAAFRQMLAHNLHLDPVSLVPGPGSTLTAPPSYHLLIYNTGIADAPEAVRHVVANGVVTEQATPIPPVALGDTVTVPGPGGIQVRIEAPTVIAAVSFRTGDLSGRGTIVINRWASAKIAKTSKQCP